MKLINKDDLVSEIEKQIELGKFKCQQSQEDSDLGNYIAWSEHTATCEKILSFINTLEVKEVDLEKESELWIKENQDTAGFFNLVDYAKHFFERGLEMNQKGE